MPDADVPFLTGSAYRVALSDILEGDCNASSTIKFPNRLSPLARPRLTFGCAVKSLPNTSRKQLTHSGRLFSRARHATIVYDLGL